MVTAPRFAAIGASLTGLVLSAALLAGAAHAESRPADPLQEADRALAAGDFAAAYGQYLEIAERDALPLVQFNLALFHEYGWGRPVDRVAACRWHEQAARGAVPLSVYRAAQCTAGGVHRPADPEAAAAGYREAAELGQPLALCDLGALYLAGTGLPLDPAQGLALCARAAAQGAAEAQLRLALMYREAPPPHRDPASASRWLRAAAAQGQAEAQCHLGRTLAADVETADEALYWLETAASQGFLPAYLPTARAYFNRPRDTVTGRLAARDLAKAYLWSRAAERRAADPEARDAAREPLAEVRREMPDTWVAELESKVDEHLAGLGP